MKYLIFTICSIFIIVYGCKKKDPIIKNGKLIDVDCHLATIQNDLGAKNPITTLTFNDEILVELITPRTKKSGRFYYSRIQQIGTFSIYDTADIEISKSIFYFDKNNRCTLINDFQNSIKIGYSKFTLDAEGYIKKRENYNAINDSLLTSQTYTFDSGNLTKMISYNALNTIISSSKLEYDNKPVIVESDNQTLLLNHKSNRTHLIKRVITDSSNYENISEFENFYNAQGHLTHWIQDGFNQTNFTYKCK